MLTTFTDEKTEAEKKSSDLSRITQTMKLKHKLNLTAGYGKSKSQSKSLEL